MHQRQLVITAAATSHSKNISIWNKNEFSEKNELWANLPAYLMKNQPFSLSDDDYDSREENVNSRFAKLLQIDPVKENIDSDSDKSSNENSRGIDFSDEDEEGQGRKIEKHSKGTTPPRTRPSSEHEIVNQESQSQEKLRLGRKTKKSLTVHLVSEQRSNQQEEQHHTQNHNKIPKKSRKKEWELVQKLSAYMEEEEEQQKDSSIDAHQLQGNLKVRSQSYEERTCEFTYLTNLRSSFARSQLFKREANYEIFDCILATKWALNQQQNGQLAQQIIITIKELTNIMGSFLASNLLELKNGECKLLLERLFACEKLFDKYAPFAFSSTGQRQSILVSERSPSNNNNNNNSGSFKMTAQLSNPSSSSVQQPPTQQSSVNSSSWKKDTPNFSLISSISSRNLQKSKFFCCDESDSAIPAKFDSQQQKQSISSSEQTHDKTFSSSSAVCDTKDSNDSSTQTKEISILPHIIEENEMGVSNFLAPPLLLNREKSSTASDDKGWREREQSLENAMRAKQQSLVIHPITAHLKKIFSAVRFIFTKTGSLLHYQKMQTYFFKEEESIKSKQHSKIVHMQHKKNLSFEPTQYDSTAQDNLSSSLMSPLSTSSNGLQASFLNSPMSTSSSNGNMMQNKGKDEGFNAGIFYQKVNENNDDNDKEYTKLISILRMVRNLETDPSGTCSKKAKLLFYYLKQQLLDSVPVFLEKRSFLLGRFLIWKMKRWYTLYKRTIMENKKINLFVNQFLEKQVCRICDEKVSLKNFKFHSQYCKQREEISKDLRVNLKSINQELFYFLQKSRSLSVKCQLLQKKIEKIEKISQEKQAATPMSQSVSVLRGGSTVATRYSPISRKSTGAVEEHRLKRLQENKANGSHQFKEYLVTQRSKSIVSTLTDPSVFEGQNNAEEHSSSFSRISEDDSSESDSSSNSSSSSSSTKSIKLHGTNENTGNINSPIIASEILQRKDSKKRKGSHDIHKAKEARKEIGSALLNGVFQKNVDVSKSIDYTADEGILEVKTESKTELPMISENANEEEGYSKCLISIELPTDSIISKKDEQMKEIDFFKNQLRSSTIKSQEINGQQANGEFEEKEKDQKQLIDLDFPILELHERSSKSTNSQRDSQNALRVARQISADYVADSSEVCSQNGMKESLNGEQSSQINNGEDEERSIKERQNHQQLQHCVSAAVVNFPDQQDSMLLFQQNGESRDTSPTLQLHTKEDNQSAPISKMKMTISVDKNSIKPSPSSVTVTATATDKLILQNTLKKIDNSNQSDLEQSSQASSTSLRLMNSSHDIKSNSVRINLNRLVTLDVNKVASPFKFKQPEISSPVTTLNSNPIENQDTDKTAIPSQAFNFSSFQEQQESCIQYDQAASGASSSNQNQQETIGSKKVLSSTHIPDSVGKQDFQQQHRQSYPVSQRQRILGQISQSPSHKLSRPAETPSNGISKQNNNNNNNNNSSSPSSSNSLSSDNQKVFNCASSTQFMEPSSLKEDESIKQKIKRISQQLKAQKANNQVSISSPNMKQSIQDQKMQLEVQKLSINFELKIQQHQLKSSQICLRIAGLIQYLSKMFFIQDFSHNCKRKRIMLDDNKQKIEFLLNKSMIPKDFASKIRDILSIFSVRVELLEKLQAVEKQLKSQNDDIDEELEKQEDISVSNESETQKNSSSKMPSNTTNSTQRVPFKRGGIRSGTQVSNNTAGSRDSPSNFSDKQSELKANSSLHTFGSSQMFRDKNLRIEVPSTLQKYLSNIGSRSQQQSQQSPSLNSIKMNYAVAISISPLRKRDGLKHMTMTESLMPTGHRRNENNRIFERQQQQQQQEQQESEESSPLNPLIQRIQKLQEQKEEQQQRKQFVEEIGEQRRKFDEIQKQAMQKFEDQMMEETKDQKPSFHNGYFSDGTIEHCYECLETTSKKESTTTNISDFEFLKLISKGAFGRVWLVKKKNTDNVYAMKIVNLAEKMNKNNLVSLQNERDIFGIVSGDFVVKAVYTFSHESYLCFVMEYMIGGDLGGIMQQYGVLDQQIARFYIAEIILAVSQLHKVGIVHRDLKPDNLLLDSKGHLKLTDFGLSDMGMKNRNMDNRKAKKIKQDFNNLKRGMNKISEKYFPGQTPRTKSEQTRELRRIKCNLDVMLNKGVINSEKLKDSQSYQQSQSSQQEKKYRIIGTPDYIPPEVIKGSSNLNSPTLDWWSVGIILFEMLVGIPPFNDDTVELIFQNILALKVPWDQIPIGYGEDEVSPEAEDLIKKLMDPNPATRLGVNGVKEIQQHPFFKGFDWENVRKMTAPVVPKVKNILDTSNFEKQIQYAEKEKMDPFFGLAKGEDEVNKAKDMLKGYNFQMKRYDILYEENCQQLEEIEKKMKLMEEEIIKDEEELEKLEVEYGTDNDDPQEQQPFNIPRSVLTFNELDTSGTNSNTSTSIYATRSNMNPYDAQINPSLVNIAEQRLASFSHQNTIEEEDGLNEHLDDDNYVSSLVESDLNKVSPS